MSGSRTTLYGAIVIHLFCNVLWIQSVIAQGGPVYINPNAPIKSAPVAPAAAVVLAEKVVVQTAQPEYVTQTVYGFLDFTTTIGSTIMVFSPQSAAPEPAPAPKPSTTVVRAAETRDTVAEEAIKTTIQPTKSTKVITQATMTSFPSVVLPGSDPLDMEHVVIKEELVNVQSVPVHDNTNDDEDDAEEGDEYEEHHQHEDDEEDEEDGEDGGEEDANDDRHEIPLIQSSIVEVLSSESSIDPLQPVANHLLEPEYDFLSRQPSEYVEESFRVVNLKPQNKLAAKPKRVQQTRREDNHPTGLVTKLGGTVVKDGSTTVHETSVIGTYINGKYAQVLQSTSQVIANKPKITPTSSLRILKTAAPAIPKNRYNVDPTPSFPEETHGQENLRAKKAPAQSAAPSKNNRFRHRNSKESYDYLDEDYRSSETKKNRNRPAKKRYNRPNKEATEPSSVAAVFAETPAPPPSYRNRNKPPPRYNDHPSNNRAQEQHSSSSSQKNDLSLRRPSNSFKSRIQPTPSDQDQQSTSLYKFKLNRTPGRWQYKTSPKPRVTIRKSPGGDSPAAETKLPTINERPDNENDDLHVEDNDPLASAPSINGDVLNDDGNHIDKPPPVETLKVEISTPADFSDTYFEIATIKSPYTFQVGTVRNTRFITVTSTFQKVIEPEPSPTPINGPLTENILATTSHIDKEQNLLETTVATLPPLYLASNMETPPLETLTETFSTSHIVLKTHILPVIYDNNVTQSHTLIQTYQVTRLVTATKTLPPAELYNFVPSKRLNEFNSRLDEAGSELHLELEFGDNNEEDDEEEDGAPRRELPPDLDLSNIGTDFDLDGVDKRRVPNRKAKPTPPPTTTTPTPALSPELQQQLALLRLLNPAAAAQIPQLVSKPVVKVDTIYDSHVIPIFNGLNTILSTISRPISTVTRTEYEVETSTLPIPPIQQLNPLFPQQQPQLQQQIQITSTPVVTNAMVTQTNSKVLKLTFGAKTAYTTLFSTQVVPTLLTTYITNSVQVQPTAAAFPGYFPAPYGFPYVG